MKRSLTKSYFLSIAILFLVSPSIAQTNTFPASGNVGIGTLNPENGFQLDVSGLGTIGTPGNARLYLGTFDRNNAFIQARDQATNQNLKFFASSYSFEIGNVGIGTSNPFSRLHVKDGPHTGTIALGDDAYPTLLCSSASSGEFRIDNRSSFIGYLTFYPNGQNTTVGSEAMRICASGNIGIGTTDPKNYRLAVNGKIRAQEIKVEASPWPDYVFADSYSLPTLQETEKHIKEKGHLPGIPSAAEVKANGIDLGEMNAKLLQKIEELTLHLIELKKQSELRDEKQNKEIAKLRSKFR
ncbi:hypothetical protein [Pedobacter hiemivivus]|uniref:BZIP transcription factor n=1 Tax=Pedobacter hiemivivus TaxID=2530454 RepID=A0A4R0NDB9_9SPHI|nr:hypothetical protein [Pedobacter hiemivivus]TCC97697.1 hypothetical protein EZ444_07210 [Pedobacter hiemivivus]